MRSTSGEFSDYYKRMLVTNAISMGIVVLVLSAELVVYWRFRHHIVKKQLAIMHVVGIFLGLVAFPILYSLYLAFGRDGVDNASTMAIIRNVITWTLVIIAHGLFITVWIDTRKRRKAEALVASGDGHDILNDYAEE